MKLRFARFGFLLAAVAGAHPMGNFSVNHYARIEVGARVVRIDYVLDLAEIPSFELLQKWNVAPASSREALEPKVAREARVWIQNLAFRVNGRAVRPRSGTFENAALHVDKGAGGMTVMRVALRLSLDAAPGTLEYEDRNYAGRAGWKEIVVVAGPGALVEKSSAGNLDRSQELTAYPQDPTAAPPQETEAKVGWRFESPGLTERTAPPVESERPVRAAAPVRAPALPAGPVAPQPAALGTVVRGDSLSRLLSRRRISWDLILLGMAVAFGLGAMHALSPGHGKTIVAAYLVGSRGTLKHAIFLGAMVTFTHTFSVFCLGLVTLYLYRDVLPENVVRLLGAVSGLSIACIGALLLYRRTRNLRSGARHTHPQHEHDHHHEHDRQHGHDHGHGPHSHVHSHVPEGEVTLGSLIALGASGGLVPCPSALVLLLSSIALGRVGLGLLLLLGFSLGLATVLMGIGMLVLFAKNRLPESGHASQHVAFRVIPVLSAAVIVCLGLLMTGVSLGVIRPNRIIG